MSKVLGIVIEYNMCVFEFRAGMGPTRKRPRYVNCPLHRSAQLRFLDRNLVFVDMLTVARVHFHLKEISVLDDVI